MSLDSSVAHSGRRSLVVRQPSPEASATLLTRLQPRSAPSSGAVRLTGWIRTELTRGTAGLALALLARPYAALQEAPAYADTTEGIVVFSQMQGWGAEGRPEWQPFSVLVPASPGTAALLVGLRVDGEGTAWFDDLEVEAVPPETLDAPSTEAAAYLDAALDLMQAHVLNREDVDWPAFRARAHSGLLGAQSARDTYPVIRLALKTLNPHSVLHTPDEMTGLSHDDVDLALPEGELLGSAGYLYIPAFDGWAEESMDRYAQASHTLLAAYDAAGACGYVVDLRGNSGGNVFPMLAATGPLLYDRLDQDGMHYADGSLRLDDDTLRVHVGPSGPCPDGRACGRADRRRDRIVWRSRRAPLHRASSHKDVRRALGWLHDHQRRLPAARWRGLVRDDRPDAGPHRPCLRRPHCARPTRCRGRSGNAVRRPGCEVGAPLAGQAVGVWGRAVRQTRALARSVEVSSPGRRKSPLHADVRLWRRWLRPASAHPLRVSPLCPRPVGCTAVWYADWHTRDDLDLTEAASRRSVVVVPGVELEIDLERVYGHEDALRVERRAPQERREGKRDQKGGDDGGHDGIAVH